LLNKNSKTKPKDTFVVYAQMYQCHWGKSKAQGGT